MKHKMKDLKNLTFSGPVVCRALDSLGISHHKFYSAYCDAKLLRSDTVITDRRVAAIEAYMQDYDFDALRVGLGVKTDETVARILRRYKIYLDIEEAAGIKAQS